MFPSLLPHGKYACICIANCRAGKLQKIHEVSFIKNCKFSHKQIILFVIAVALCKNVFPVTVLLNYSLLWKKHLRTSVTEELNSVSTFVRASVPWQIGLAVRSSEFLQEREELKPGSNV